MATATKRRSTPSHAAPSANGADPAADEFNLTHEIGKLIEEVDDPTPEAIINRLVSDGLPENVMEEAARQGLRSKVLQQFRRLRRRQRIQGHGTWAAGRLAYNILQRRENIDGVWKLLADCTRADVETIVDQYRDRAVYMTIRADEYEAVAEAMKKSRASVVADLGAEKVLEVIEAVNLEG